MKDMQEAPQWAVKTHQWKLLQVRSRVVVGWTTFSPEQGSMHLPVRGEIMPI